MEQVLPTFGRLENMWSIQPEAMEHFIASLRGLTPAQIEAARRQMTEQAGALRYQMSGRTAVVNIVGPISKTPSIWQLIFGGTSTVQVEAALQAAANDPAVHNVLLYVDSPGGTVAGTSDLADAVFRARSRKRIVAYCSDLAASAAYWIASQAHQVVGNSAAVVGSIGTYSTVADWSKLYDQVGIKVHVIKAGAFKGTGVQGTAVTPEQLAEMQKTVDSINSLFIAAVARGRRMSPATAAKLADGRVHVGADAVKLGLMDRVARLGDVLGELNRSDDEQRKLQAADPARIIAEFNAAVVKTMEAQQVGRQDAICIVADKNPDLHRAYIRATNPKADAACFA